MNPQLALIGPLGMPELIVLALLGLLIFGKRLPEVGRSLGKGIVEFKKGLSGAEDDVSKAAAGNASANAARQLEPPASGDATARQTETSRHQS